MKKATNSIYKKAITITLLFMAVMVSSLRGQSVNFTGSYQISETKTDFGDAPHSVLPAKLTISQLKDRLTVQRITVDSNKQETVNSETLKFDGSKTETTLKSGNKRTASLKGSANQNSFTIDSRSVTPDGKLNTQINETWTLEADGKTLVLTRQVEQGNGLKYTIKGYYDRQ